MALCVALCPIVSCALATVCVWPSRAEEEAAKEGEDAARLELAGAHRSGLGSGAFAPEANVCWPRPQLQPQRPSSSSSSSQQSWRSWQCWPTNGMRSEYSAHVPGSLGRFGRLPAPVRARALSECGCKSAAAYAPSCPPGRSYWPLCSLPLAALPPAPPTCHCVSRGNFSSLSARP